LLKETLVLEEEPDLGFAILLRFNRLFTHI
jgi:hypothetical protein